MSLRGADFENDYLRKSVARAERERDEALAERERTLRSLRSTLRDLSRAEAENRQLGGLFVRLLERPLRRLEEASIPVDVEEIGRRINEPERYAEDWLRFVYGGNPPDASVRPAATAPAPPPGNRTLARAPRGRAGGSPSPPPRSGRR